MNKNFEIVFGLEKTEYRTLERGWYINFIGKKKIRELKFFYGEWFPLPYGEMFVKTALLKGYVNNLNDNIPKYATTFGERGTTISCYFSGRIKNEKGSRILLEGEFSPSELIRIETSLSKVLPLNLIREIQRNSWKKADFYRQWDLDLYPLNNWDNVSKLLSKIVDKKINTFRDDDNYLDIDPTREVIYDHQFFGNYRIYWVGESEKIGGAIWAIRTFGEVKVVCPNHLEQSFKIANTNWLIAVHKKINPFYL